MSQDKERQVRQAIARRLVEARLQYAARIGRPVSQVDVAHLLAVTSASVSAWETGTTVPKLVQLVGLARVYGLKLGWPFADGECATEPALARAKAR